MEFVAALASEPSTPFRGDLDSAIGPYFCISAVCGAEKSLSRSGDNDHVSEAMQQFT